MKKKQIPCPQCGKPCEYSSQNQFRPFCSERCKLIDLGEWAEGNYSVPGESTQISPTNEDEEPDDPSLH